MKTDPHTSENAAPAATAQAGGGGGRKRGREDETTAGEDIEGCSGGGDKGLTVAHRAWTGADLLEAARGLCVDKRSKQASVSGRVLSDSELR